MQSLQPHLETLDLGFNNDLRELGFLLAPLHVGSDRILQIVNVIHEDSVKLVHLRINVSRHRNINEEHWAVPAPRKKHFAMLATEDGNRSAGGSDNDVGLLAMFIQLVEA